MEHQIYNVNDSRVRGFNRVFFAGGDAEAIRHYMVLLIQPGGVFNQTPGDFSLVHIGSFDSENGTFQNLDTRTVCTYAEIEHHIERYRAQRELLKEGGAVGEHGSPEVSEASAERNESEANA